MMYFPHFVVVVVAGLCGAAVNAHPMMLELAYLLSGYDGLKITNCDISGAAMPRLDGANLAPPGAGLVLVHVALGRGTQNYTCADSTDGSIPATNGAVATLYDASCLLAKQPERFHSLPDALLKIPRARVKKEIDQVSRKSCQNILIGHHYFAPNNTVAVFDFLLKEEKYRLAGRRDQSVPAFTAASKSEVGLRDGAVDWLRITAIPSMSEEYKLGYRVQTAGGKPPDTCEGLSKEFTVEYASEYWIYS